MPKKVEVKYLFSDKDFKRLIRLIRISVGYEIKHEKLQDQINGILIGAKYLQQVETKDEDTTD